MNRKNVLAAVLFASMGMMVVSSSGCGGTQYGGRPSSIPRDVDSDDATSSQQQQSTGTAPRTVPPARPAPAARAPAPRAPVGPGRGGSAMTLHPEIKVLPDPAAIAAEAAERIVRAADEAIALSRPIPHRALRREHAEAAVSTARRRAVSRPHRLDERRGLLRRRALRPAGSRGPQLPHGARDAARRRCRSPATTSTACAARSSRRTRPRRSTARC